ncbi:MAG: [FeFe] hydrogenase H-cluster radical SAM maturase HydG [Bacillota bacterium]
MQIPTWLAEADLENLLREAAKPSAPRVREILTKAATGQGLTLAEAAQLLQIEDEELLTELFQAAGQVKERIYGRRVVIFAPLYLTNECHNNCLYCGFRAANRSLARRTLTVEEAVAEAKALESQGHKRLLLVAGENGRQAAVDYIVQVIEAIYQQADIRRLNVNIAPLDGEGFRRLKAAGIGTYQLFQETYHLDTYRQMHPAGAKADYHWRVSAPERALQAGIDDIGMGVLYGLYDHRYDTLALLAHAHYLDRTYGVGPHTLSVPRLRPAPGSQLHAAPYPVSDRDFKKIVAILRLAVPYTGLILSTRETPALRDELLHLGISQISAGSATSPGGYRERARTADPTEQFVIEDHRTLDEVITCVLQAGFIPSFCTACYRSGRTGERFMQLAKSGNIQNVCQPNALLTLQEYLLHFGSEAARNAAAPVLAKEQEAIRREDIRRLTADRLRRLEQGEKDLYL